MDGDGWSNRFDSIPILRIGSNQWYLHIIWRENKVSIEISKRWHRFRVNGVKKHNITNATNNSKFLNIPSVLSILMKRPLKADSLEQRMLKKIFQDLKWSQLNCNVPRNTQPVALCSRFFFAVNIADVDWINLLWLMYTFIYETEYQTKCGPTKLWRNTEKFYLKLKAHWLSKLQKVKCKQLESQT